LSCLVRRAVVRLLVVCCQINLQFSLRWLFICWKSGVSTIHSFIKEKQGKDQAIAAAEVRRTNQLIYDQIALLGTFIGDSDAWYDWQKNFRRLTREFEKDLKYRVFLLMCGGQAERKLDEALSAHPVSDGGNPYQHAVDILNGIYVMRTKKIMI